MCALVALILVGGVVAWCKMSSSSPLSERDLVDRLSREQAGGNDTEMPVVQGQYQPFVKGSSTSAEYAGATVTSKLLLIFLFKICVCWCHLG